MTLKPVKLHNVRNVLWELRRLVSDEELDLPSETVDVLFELRDRILSDFKEAESRFWKCMHCGKICSDAFMVKNHVWKIEAGLSYEGTIHLDCFEEVLGRRITFDDLVKCDMNKQIEWWYRRGKTSHEDIK